MLAHRLLGGYSSILSISCPSLGSALIAAACAHLWISFRQCSESPLLMHPETIGSCLLNIVNSLTTNEAALIFAILQKFNQIPSNSILKKRDEDIFWRLVKIGSCYWTLLEIEYLIMTHYMFLCFELPIMN